MYKQRVQCFNGNMDKCEKFSPWMNCLRRAIYSLNAFFTVIAGFLIAAGAEITGMYNNFYGFLNYYYTVPAHVFIGMGAILVVTTCIGWFGAIKLEPVVLSLYSVFLLVLICVGVTISIISFVGLYAGDYSIHTRMFNSVKAFELDENVRHSWNYVQEEYSCCGVLFPENWYGIKQDGLNGGVRLLHKGFTIRFPYSCCVGKNCDAGLIYEEGCVNQVVDYVSKATLLIGYLSIVIAVIQVITVIITYLLCIHIQWHKNIGTVKTHLSNKSMIILASNTISSKAAFV